MSASQRIGELERHYEMSLSKLGGSPSEGMEETGASVYEDSLDFGKTTPMNPYVPHRGRRGRHGSPSGAVRGATRQGGSSSSPTRKNNNSPGQREMTAQLGKMSEGEKDATIRHLKDEIERLKGKVNTIVQSAETSLEEAIESQESMRKQMQNKVAQEQKKYQHLVAENAALKEVIMSLNEEIINERTHVEKAMRFMERMRTNPTVAADKNKVFSLTQSLTHSQKLH